jgi:hypothetical protein
MSLFVNMRLGCYFLTVTNTLAYCLNVRMTIKKLNNIAATMTEGCHDNHHIDNKQNDTQNNVTQDK